MNRAPKSLHETENYQSLDPGVNMGKIAAYVHISEEFMELGKGRLETSSFSQEGLYRYSVGVFCLGHAFELLYKSLLLLEAKNDPKGHNFGSLYKKISETRRKRIKEIIVGEGWSSVDEFHKFMLETINPVHRKYFDVSSGWDIWSHDGTGKNISHKLWPGLVQLWKDIHDYAASQIWKNPNLPIC